MIAVDVVIEDDFAKQSPVIAQQLIDKGFVVEQVLSLVGMICGKCEESLISELETIPGVMAVEKTRNCNVADLLDK